ncbi:uncharacterized protein TEOVI_000045400 [Trypanosoma equiperdum]|uniref:Uncharacterized protein n=3 Tax=Trypanozoon TaxID=39700 RepID=Q38FX8_TRYB2|nr:hypothetical protein, conserved [Trypanosoma brucei gambiense DAL972]XP_803459.1 hypothetical protein, conserved [Trypanosoma brucei brucei TREU927]EAN76292.1 hypothetical protein, conserved [Trypanosoma brucei brucei TREU927]CBH13968.1 hypothetical protein, conserved [Trypanosoma brucei gambiense DAL972]SCU67494.1 hypothetical protein, conserved [Trypanosoma equiperdum]|eukprot:XP_011776242.1 hypothetical protein, conserved [Trypanosoma brucei gambiense DAL972]
MTGYNLKTIAKAEIGSLCHDIYLLDPASGESLEAHVRLAEAEMQALRRQKQFVEHFVSQTVEERRAAAKARCAEAQRRREELTQKIQQLRGKTLGESHHNGLARRWAAAYNELAHYRERVSNALMCSPYTIVTTVQQEAGINSSFDLWPPLSSSATSVIMELDNAGEDSTSLSPSVLRDQLELIAKMQLRVNALLNRERHRRQLQRECVSDLLRDQKKLLLWCQEQIATLKELKSLEDLREFCASFASNVNVMDTNFLVLLERSELLEPNQTIRDALMEVNREWIELAVSTYQKTREALRQTHSLSGVEEGCRRWANVFELRVKRILTKACAVSSHPVAGHEHLPERLQENCASLLKEFSNVSIVMHHICKLSLSEEFVAHLEGALRRTLLTPLSLLTHTFAGDAQFVAQREYADRLREVSEWLDGRATGNAYSRIMKQVEHLRTIAENLLESLPEKDNCADVTS